MEKIRQLLAGKKTYLSAGVIALAGCCGWWGGTLDNAQLMEVLGVAGALAGLGAKSQRNAEAVLAALEDLRQTQDQRAAGQKIDPVQIAKHLAEHIIFQPARDEHAQAVADEIHVKTGATTEVVGGIPMVVVPAVEIDDAELPGGAGK